MSNKVFIFEKIKKIFYKIQKIGIDEILNYFFINFKILYAFFFTLNNSKKIFFKKGNFLSFSEPNAISHTYYKIENLNFAKFGNQGLSNIINFENYSLSNFWNISRLSVLIYSKYGCLVTLLGNFLFIFFHIIFIPDSNPIWVSPIIFFLFIFSTTIYGSCFACQNYSPLAYLFFPLFIFCTINYFLIFSSIFLLFIAIFSFSFFIISILFIILLYNFSIINILSIFLPSIIYFFFF